MSVYLLRLLLGTILSVIIGTVYYYDYLALSAVMGAVILCYYYMFIVPMITESYAQTFYRQILLHLVFTGALLVWQNSIYPHLVDDRLRVLIISMLLTLMTIQRRFSLITFAIIIIAFLKLLLPKTQLTVPTTTAQMVDMYYFLCYHVPALLCLYFAEEDYGRHHERQQYFDDHGPTIILALDIDMIAMTILTLVINNI